MQHRDYESTTRSILDNFFMNKQNKIIKENNYDFKTELDYNKILKFNIIDTILTKDLYILNEYTKECFEKSSSNILNEIRNKIKGTFSGSPVKILKTDGEIENDIKIALRTYYFEKEKKTQQKEKKLYINIIFIKSDKKTSKESNVVLVKKRLYDGVPTFSDIKNFQKKLQEDISKYIQKCQNPKDIELEVKEQCTNIFENSENFPNIKNKLWSNICTNYIKCVYDENYDPKEILSAAKAAKAAKVAAAKVAAAKAAEAKAAEAKAKLVKAVKAVAKPGADAAKAKAKAVGGGFKYVKKKTISKKPILNQHNTSVKLFKEYQLH